MTEYGAPWDGILLGDASIAPYSALEWARIWKLRHGAGVTFPNYGVFAGTGDGTFQPLEVRATAVPSASADVKIGAALINGRFYETTAVVNLAVTANASGNPRIDTVILRVDYVAQTVRLAVKVGTPAGVPVRPTLQQDATFWEIPLADIAVANGFTVLPQTSFTQRQRVINSQSYGWQSHAYPQNYAWGTTIGVSFTLTPAQTVLIPIALHGNFLFEDIIMRTLTSTTITYGWDLYVEDTNDGNVSENTLRRIVEGNTTTVTMGSSGVNIPAIAAITPPILLTPGLYWLAWQNRHASNNQIIDSSTGNAFDATDTPIFRKVTTNPNGATLDAVTGWTALQSALCIRLRGRVFGQTVPI